MLLLMNKIIFKEEGVLGFWGAIRYLNQVIKPYVLLPKTPKPHSYSRIPSII
jgi:hypothetical protein